MGGRGSGPRPGQGKGKKKKKSVKRNYAGRTPAQQRALMKHVNSVVKKHAKHIASVNAHQAFIKMVGARKRSGPINPNKSY